MSSYSGISVCHFAKNMKSLHRCLIIPALLVLAFATGCENAEQRNLYDQAMKMKQTQSAIVLFLRSRLTERLSVWMLQAA
jgi:hypothetical protein